MSDGTLGVCVGGGGGCREWGGGRMWGREGVRSLEWSHVSNMSESCHPRGLI